MFWEELKAEVRQISPSIVVGGALGWVAAGYVHGRDPDWRGLLAFGAAYTAGIFLLAARRTYLPNYDRWPRAGKALLAVTGLVAAFVTNIILNVSEEQRIGGYRASQIAAPDRK